MRQVFEEVWDEGKATAWVIASQTESAQMLILSGAPDVWGTHLEHGQL